MKRKIITYQILLFSLVLLILFPILGLEAKKDIQLVSIDNMELLEMNEDQLSVKVTATVENQRKINAKVRSIDANIIMDGYQIGVIAYKGRDLQIAKQSKSQISLPATIDLAQLQQVYPALMSANTVTLSLQGKFKLDLGLFNINFKKGLERDFNFREQIIALTQSDLGEDGVKIKSIRPSKLGLTKTTLLVTVLFSNNMAVDYTINQIHLDFYLNQAKKKFGVWDSEDPITITAKSEEEIKSELVVDNAKGFTQGLTSLFSRKIVKTKGEADILIGSYTFEVPIEQKIEL